jgi:protoheme IX farnesyltransferase
MIKLQGSNAARLEVPVDGRHGSGGLRYLSGAPVEGPGLNGAVCSALDAASPFHPTVPAEKSWVAVYADLFKARLTVLVLLTTLVGFYMGFRGPVNLLLMLNTLAGTALMAGGASALNQLWERKHDARMRRTQDRPLPSGRLQPQTVLVVGCSSALLGLVYLGLWVNPITSLVGACSLLCYLLIYTPLKRVTWLNTVVGAVPGALPPLMGWVAARGELSGAGLSLFAIQALWQMPHFLAIAWMYRDEYANAGFKMLPVYDPTGKRTGRQAVLYASALLAVSLCPFLFHLAGPVYLTGALVLGLVFVGYAARFSRCRTIGRSRQLFYLSLAYLPLLLGLMVADKLK